MPMMRPAPEPQRTRTWQKAANGPTRPKHWWRNPCSAVARKHRKKAKAAIAAKPPSPPAGRLRSFWRPEHPSQRKRDKVRGRRCFRDWCMHYTFVPVLFLRTLVAGSAMSLVVACAAEPLAQSSLASDVTRLDQPGENSVADAIVETTQPSFSEWREQFREEA